MLESNDGMLQTCEIEEFSKTAAEIISIYEKKIFSDRRKWSWNVKTNKVYIIQHNPMLFVEVLSVKICKE